MAVGLAIGIGALVGAAIGFFLIKGTPKQENMKPVGLDSFQVTYNEEGPPFPFVRGVVRRPANLLWHGNLVTEEIQQEVGGKGGGGGSVTTGIKYWIDHWQGLALGPAIVVGMYVDGKRWSNDSEITHGDYSWYNTYYVGFNAYNPNYYYNENFPGVERSFTVSTGNILNTDNMVVELQERIGYQANSMRGLCHVWMPDWLVGENRAFLQNIDWLIEGYSESGLTNANMTKGCNPAALIYDLLIQGGTDPGSINTTSFQAAADHFYSKGYALQMAIDQQVETREAINFVLDHIDASFFINENDEYELTAWDENDTSVTTISTDEFINFKFERRDWTEVYSDFNAKYIDEEQDYTERAVKVINSAARNILGFARPMTLNLTGFREKTSASRRLWEVARKESYPYSKISFTTLIKHQDINPGDIIEIVNDDYGITSAFYRVLDKDYSEIDRNEVTFNAIEFLEGEMPDVYEQASDPIYTLPDNYAQLPLEERYIPLPYNNLYYNVPSVLCLLQRQGQEDGFHIYASASDTGPYTFKTTCRTFSMKCTLTADVLGGFDYLPRGVINPNYGVMSFYGWSGMYYDDQTVITLDVDHQLLDKFGNISEEDLFLGKQVAVMGDEIIPFRYYTVISDSRVRISGLLRGYWNSPIRKHRTGYDTYGDIIWLTTIDQNLWFNPGRSAWYVKALPFLQADVVPIDYKSSVFLEDIIDGGTSPQAPVVKMTYIGVTEFRLDMFPAPTTSPGAGNKSIYYQNDAPAYDDGSRYEIYWQYSSALISTNTPYQYDTTDNPTLYNSSIVKVRQVDYMGNKSPYLTVVNQPSAAEQFTYGTYTIPYVEWQYCFNPSDF